MIECRTLSSHRPTITLPAQGINVGVCPESIGAHPTDSIEAEKVNYPHISVARLHCVWRPFGNNIKAFTQL